MAYDSPQFSVTRDQYAVTTAGATGEYGKFRTFAAATLRNVAAVVLVAGTSSVHAYDVYVGTDSVGTIPLGTATAGSSVSVAINAAVPALTQMSVKSKADATGTAHIVYDYIYEA
jgi:hypothetical protein